MILLNRGTVGIELNFLHVGILRKSWKRRNLSILKQSLSRDYYEYKKCPYFHPEYRISSSNSQPILKFHRPRCKNTEMSNGSAILQQVPSYTPISYCLPTISLRSSSINQAWNDKYIYFHTSSLNNKDDSVKRKQLKEDDEENKLGLFGRFKLMYKRYWYVLAPVHAVTSAIWFGTFYFAAKSGIEISHLEALGISESVLYYLKEYNAGYYGIAYGLYKIATPARYTVTLAGTTLSIGYLKKKGYIKPVPTTNELKEMYQDKKEVFKDRTEEVKEKVQDRYQETKEELLEKREEFREKYKEKKVEFMEKYKDNLKDKKKHKKS